MTTPADDNRWLITATHECGHIAGYVHFRWRFGGVRIWQDDNGEIKGSVVSPAANYDRISRAICCMAGPVAEWQLTGIPPFEQPGSRSDLEMACEALGRVAFKPRLDLISITPFTKLMVDHEWQMIQLVARQLIICRELSYDEVRELIWAAPEP